MKFKSKQKTTETPAPKVLTEQALKEQLSNLNKQLVDSQTKTVMIQGAIQAVTLQIEDLNPKKDEKVTNGVN
jgi:predicted  nucleic acid-binding Zn-ribbon protein